MMGPKLRAFAPLCRRSLEDLVPASNFSRHLATKLDRGFVRTTSQACGRTASDPRVFCKLQGCSGSGAGGADHGQTGLRRCL
jgi:hypothetical protein